MRTLEQRLEEAQIRERLELVGRWRASGPSMTGWAEVQGLEVGESFAGSWLMRAAGEPSWQGRR